MASEHKRGTSHSRMRWFTRVAADTKRSAAACSNELPPDFNPAVHDGESFEAASFGNGGVNLWYSVSLYEGFVEERRAVLRVDRGRFRL